MMLAKQVDRNIVRDADMHAERIVPCTLQASRCGLTSGIEPEICISSITIALKETTFSGNGRKVIACEKAFGHDIELNLTSPGSGVCIPISVNVLVFSPFCHLSLSFLKENMRQI